MLKHLGEHEAEAKIKRALDNVYRTREKLTKDVGGQAGTSQFADSVIEEMQSASAVAQS
jgi:isocitrate dehydrogenase (NAD+)